jgi:hypothetical protein
MFPFVLKQIIASYLRFVHQPVFHPDFRSTRFKQGITITSGWFHPTIDDQPSGNLNLDNVPCKLVLHLPAVFGKIMLTGQGFQNQDIILSGEEQTVTFSLKPPQKMISAEDYQLE